VNNLHIITLYKLHNKPSCESHLLRSSCRTCRFVSRRDEPSGIWALPDTDQLLITQKPRGAVSGSKASELHWPSCKTMCQRYFTDLFSSISCFFSFILFRPFAKRHSNCNSDANSVVYAQQINTRQLKWRHIWRWNAEIFRKSSHNWRES